ncbi:MAG: N-acetylneuraminate lyase [Blastopirellula sp.]|nr:MAG: N-acetylneuraminate lyase [Blastopirellula sp.]
MNSTKLQGLIAATYTPLDDDGQVNLSQIPQMVEGLLASGITGLYVCGSTGEGMSLSTEERKAVAAAYVQATKKRVPVIVQVGHNSLAEAKQLAKHAEEIGADVISATCPSYFKINDINTLIDSMSEIASGAPGLPFYYYHIPILTGSSLDMVEFLAKAGERIPTLTGLKYTDTKLHEFQECFEFENGKYDVVWGCDEMLLGALATGAKGAIGSTYNIAAPLYLRIIELFKSGEIEQAREMQKLSINMIRAIGKYPFHSGMKEVLGMLGVDCGTCRLPQPPLAENDASTLKEKLNAIGFFDWSVNFSPKNIEQTV